MTCRNERGLRVPLRAARDVSRRLISITVTNRPNVESLRPSQAAKASSRVVSTICRRGQGSGCRTGSFRGKRKYIPATGAPTPRQVARPCPPPANSVGLLAERCRSDGGIPSDGSGIFFFASVIPLGPMPDGRDLVNIIRSFYHALKMNASSEPTGHKLLTIGSTRIKVLPQTTIV